MPNTTRSGVEKYKVLDDSGLDVLLQALFNVIENNYVLRSTYESEIAALTDRVEVLEVVRTYGLSMDGASGNLTIEVPDDADVSLSIDANGDLILTSDDTEADLAISRYRFSINDDGELIATI